MSRTVYSPVNNEIPDPELLIKSLAEQGYSLETSLADLIDNSVSADADKVEILVDTEIEPFVLYLADNGSGMDRDTLARNMRFPSSSSEASRNAGDLGRFGLGMKTASFSQTRTFTVLSRAKGAEKFYGRTWDVSYLEREKEWKTLEVGPAEMKLLLDNYKGLSTGFLNPFSNYSPNTIIIWRGLYKFEDYLEDNRQTTLQKEITGTTSEYLSLVFHRYMERKISPLSIRVNNNILSPFNPFPVDQTDFRRLETNQKKFRTDSLKIEGYILPSRSLDESRAGQSVWTQHGRSLTDMEGLYIYRTDRIILFGGWNGIIKKSPRLQLARLKVDIGNSVDRFFHLNVAKSSIVIPYELRVAFLRYVSELKAQAEKEYYNRGIKKISRAGKRSPESMFIRQASSKGMLLELNEDFHVVKSFVDQLTDDQRRLFRIITETINTTINKIRQVHEDRPFTADDAEWNEQQLIRTIQLLKNSGLTGDQIGETLFDGTGLRRDTIPQHILNLLN